MFQWLLCFWIFVIVRGNEIFKNYAHGTVCGEINRIGFRIIGGIPAKKSEFPWIVSITRRGGHICGGSIISEKFIISAAHCFCTGLDDVQFYPPSAIKVSIAQHDISDKNSDSYKIAVKHIIIHHGYTCSVPKDDIALLHMEEKLKWSTSVAPICVSNVKNHHAFDDMMVTVAGWGWTHEDHSKGKRADRLQKANVWVIKSSTCRKWYKDHKKRINILDTHMCAGHETGATDACWADSGGPLMKKIESFHDKTMIIGVVSTGRGCGRIHLPGIYTRISDYIPWIEHIIGYK